MQHLESTIQRICVQWFRLQYPSCLIFAVPNGSRRDRITGAILKGEGVLAGVSDLIVVGYNKVLFIEMKVPGGFQTDSQEEFQKKVELLGFSYFICRTVDQFMSVITDAFKSC